MSDTTQLLIEKTCYKCHTALKGKSKRADRPNSTWEKVLAFQRGADGKRYYIEEGWCNKCADVL